MGWLSTREAIYTLYLKCTCFPNNNSRSKVTPFCTVPVKEEYGLKSCVSILPFPLVSTCTCIDEACLRHPLALATFEAFAGGAFVPALHCSWHGEFLRCNPAWCSAHQVASVKKKRHLGILWMDHLFPLKPLSVSTLLLVWIPQKDWKPQRGFINVLLIKYYVK